MSTFNEYTLREEIVNMWGAAGAHADVYDRILKAAKERVLGWPLTIKVLNPERLIPFGGSKITIMYHKKEWSILHQEQSYLITDQEARRIWPVMEFTGIVGKRGAFFQIRKENCV